jgi:signal peptidase I
MTATQWILFILVIQVIHFLGTWKLYIKAGRKAWEAAIPVYNAIVLMKIINRPKWWVLLLFVPIVNLFMFPIVWIETIRSFGKKTRLDSALVVLTLGFYIYYINYFTDVTYNKDRSLEPNSSLGEWISSIAFAIIAATTVHTYVMQPYVIPSSSLEKSLLIGDFLFVSKFHYGARVPMTTVALPMVHDTIPVLKKKSYLFSDNFEKRSTSLFNKLQLPYMRIPGFEKIKRNEIVVFNQPADTLLDMNDFQPDRNYYKPIDKKTNLVKRCVGIPGDSLSIVNGYVHINGKRTVLPDRAKPQWYFDVITDGQKISQNVIKNRYGVREGGQTRDGNYVLNLTDEDAVKVSKNPLVKSINKRITPKGQGEPSLFPHVSNLGWNGDNYGPIYIPKKGATVKLDKESLPFYKRVISEYERNNLTVNGNEIYINGQLATDYTFKQDYYWMMGDNRQNSLDARYWGFVPFDHVVGKPVMIWMSYDGGIFRNPRWERFFTTVHGEGKATSFRYLVFGLIALWFIYSFFFKKKKKA